MKYYIETVDMVGDNSGNKMSYCEVLHTDSWCGWRSCSGGGAYFRFVTAAAIDSVTTVMWTLAVKVTSW